MNYSKEQRGNDFIASAHGPWDGRWSIEKPADYTPGLYRFHQIEARELLKLGARLTGWEADFLQVLAYQSRDLTPMQSHLLSRIEREHQVQVAA